jgi:hypothetical protein
VPEHDLAAVLAEHWADVLPYLGPQELAFLADRIAAVLAAGGNEQAARTEVASLTTMLTIWLPPGHPVYQAISGGQRFAPALAVDPFTTAALLRALPGLETLLPDLAPVAPAAMSAGQAGPGAAQAWLLTAPARTEQQVREAGGDPSRPDLIRLTGADRAVVLPAFQFSQDGGPVPVVAEVNLLLGAAGDPWGVADWWLGQNVWLNGAPADLLGRVPDAELVRAAQAELPED